ncbi:hypothetical protein ACWGI9_00745 [Streptomyces sp. NPDC054833]
MTPDRLAPYARLPRPYRHRNVLHSTVDTYGRAHWLLGDSAGPDGLYDALVVTVEDGRPYETRLSAVRARVPVIDALPDGGFVVADARRRDDDEQVQIFDPLGRPSWTFTVGDAIEHLLTDESGNLWVGHFDEGVFDDPLSAPGVRCWSSTGTPLWQCGRLPGGGTFVECYALNVAATATWVYPYTDFPLLEVRNGLPVRVRSTPVGDARGVTVHGGRVAFFGGYDDERDRLVLGGLTDTAVEPLVEGRLLRPDGTRFGPGQTLRVVSRGSRLYVQEMPFAEWGLFDLGGVGA